MKNYFLLALSICSFCFLQAQNRQPVNENQSIVISTHTSNTSGITHTYTRQAIDGVEVFGTESSFHTTSTGKSIKENDNYVKKIDDFTFSKSATLSSAQAIVRVAEQMGYGEVRGQQVITPENASKQTIYSNSGISKRDIPVKFGYYYSKQNGITAVYELSILQLDSQHWYNFFVDANNGAILSKVDWMSSCTLLDDNHGSHNHDSSTSKNISEVKKDTNFIGPINNMMVGSYNVYPIPVESPNHGNRSVVTNPENLDASPYGWHDTNGVAGAEFTTARGNNANAYEDGDNTGFSPNGGAGLSFNFPLNTTYNNVNQSEPAAITNMFFWTNIMHDVMYIHGFDEPSGNFQETNYKGLGGAGGDSVLAEAQDGSGTCNANFGTPPDGGAPQMQMFVCGSRDGDLDNGVIAHEYGHGISTRLTGGGANSSCLNNQEQMGEGWSDFFGLVLTIEPGDLGTDPRGMGTWLTGESATGPGIRSQRYDTDTNTYTYDSIKSEVAPHGVGSVWSMMLWEMTWALIDAHGVDSNIYNFNGNLNDGGNVMALALVIEGLKLQPCSPGFVDGRDAILAADQAIYGGANECLIWEAFASRGLGFSADQGSTASKNDGTEAFDVPPITLNIPETSFCDTESAVTLDGGRVGGGVYSGTGVTDNGNGITFTFDAGIAGIGNHTITYTADDCNGLTGSSTDTIQVIANNPQPFCQAVTVTLDGTGMASIVNADVVTNLAPDTTNYTIDQTGTFSPESIAGSTTVDLQEDEGSSPIAIGFDFEFFGNTYSNLILQSNGFISFDGTGVTGSASWTPVALPASGAPNNKIAFLWDDYSPQEIANSVTYKLVGTAPNRKFIVSYTEIPLYSGTGINPDRVTTQVQLYETTYKIEVHTTSTAGTNNRTQGIENIDGTTAHVVPGRNGASWNVTNDFVAFLPGVSNTLARSCGNEITLSLSKSQFTCKDIGDNLITVTADDGNGVTKTCQTTVTVIGEETRYTGSWDNGLPNPGKKAVFAQAYNTTSADVTACSCEIEENITVTVGAGSFMKIDGNIKVDGNLIVNPTGSIVQVDKDALVENNGSITVMVETTDLKPRDVVAFGSPMTGVTREGDLGDMNRVFVHNTALFTPYTQEAVPGVNFLDSNLDNFTQHTGLLNPGEGYFVRPRPITATGNEVYAESFTGGTLNNGDMAFNVLYNGSKDASFNLMANPYASAIDANVLIAANASISEIYLWEHVITPSTTFPGADNVNHSMENVSMYNSTGPLTAAGATQPNNGILATGQGFAIKANSAGTVTYTNAMRLTDNNNTLRTTEENFNRIWLKVTNEAFNFENSTLIGFTDQATSGIDDSYDAQRLATVVSLFSHPDDGSEQLGIQARETFNSDMQIPMGFATVIDEVQNYTISIDQIQGVEIEQEEVFLVDLVTNIVTSLSKTDYSFTSAKASYDGRFILQFAPRSILNINENANDAITVYPNPTDGMLTINAPLAEINTITITDVQGRVITMVFNQNRNAVTLDLSGLTAALYFVNIETTQGNLVKQFIKK